MTPPADRPAAWMLSRVFWVPAAMYLALGAGLALLPLTNYLGLEFALATCILVGFTAGPLAVGVLHRRVGDGSRDEKRARLAEIGAHRLWLETIALHLAAVAFVLVGLAVRRLFVPPCAPGRGLSFFLLLPLVSIVYGSAWGLAVGSLVSKPRRAKTLVTLLAVATLALTAYGFLEKPTVWVYNPFFGYFPGPIYDSAAAPTVALVAYRLANLAEAWLIVLLTPLFWRRPATARPLGALRYLLIALAALTSIGVHQFRYDLGFDMDQPELARRLDGHIATEHFDIHYPRRSDIEREIRQVALDHEFRFAQIEREFGIAYPHRIGSYIYPDEETKKKLIGAGGTEYADCANHQMHLNWEGFPLTILHHEMIHVMLSDYGLPVLGFSNSVGFTEGVAVAFGGPDRWDQDLDRWAAGMKAIGRLPKVESILGLGFWRESGGRAYTAAGSFTRYLTRLPDGTAKVLAAYRDADLEAAFGRPLAELADAWLEHLTAIEATLSPAEIERARYRFGFRSIFERRCPREVGRLLEEAHTKAAKSYFHKADLLYRQAAQLDRQNPRLSQLRLPALLALGELDEAARLATDIAAAQGTPDNPALDHAGRVVGSRLIAQDAELTVAQIHWFRGERDAARAIYQRVVDDDLRDGPVREAACALHALNRPAIEPALRNYLTDLPATRLGHWDLVDAATTHPDDPVVQYLLARRMLQQGAYSHAIAGLDKALAGGLPHTAVTVEAWRGKGYAAFMLGDLDAAHTAFSVARELQTQRGADPLDETDWLDRIAAWPALQDKVPPVSAN